MVDEVADEAQSKKIKLNVSDEVKEFILKEGYDSKYGARPLRRTIQRFIEDEISEAYLKGYIKEGMEISFIMEDEKVKLIYNAQE